MKCLECGKKGPEMESHNRAVKVPGGVSRCQLSSCGRFYHKVRWHRTLCPLTLTPSDKADTCLFSWDCYMYQWFSVLRFSRFNHASRGLAWFFCFVPTRWLVADRSHEAPPVQVVSCNVLSCHLIFNSIAPKLSPTPTNAGVPQQDEPRPDVVLQGG